MKHWIRALLPIVAAGLAWSVVAPSNVAAQDSRPATEKSAKERLKERHEALKEQRKATKDSREGRKELLKGRREAAKARQKEANARRDDFSARRAEKQALNPEERAARKKRLETYRAERIARRERRRDERLKRREAIKDACAKGKAENTAEAHKLMGVERARHLKRTSQLDRIEAIAVDEDNSELLARVSELRARELTRHTARMSRINAVCTGAPSEPKETR